MHTSPGMATLPRPYDHIEAEMIDSGARGYSSRVGEATVLESRGEQDVNGTEGEYWGLIEAIGSETKGIQRILRQGSERSA